MPASCSGPRAARRSRSTTRIHASRQPVVLIDGYPLNAEVVTGIFLAMFYRPSATEAYSSVEHITTDVFLGEFVRGLSGGARR
jgi:Cytochrome b/b6/petB